MENGLKALIISDRRIGHESQSIAFCELKGIEYEVINVAYKFKLLKALSYILDFFMIYVAIFWHTKPNKKKYDLVVSAGSSTYYANKYFAKKFRAKKIALMFPKGFRNDFNIVISTLHDKKIDKNTITLPVNLNFLKPTSYYKAQKKSISFIIGGSNKNFKMSEEITQTINQIMQKFKDYEFLLTTSPRTPQHITDRLRKFNFDFFVDFHTNKINPIYDFVKQSEFVFITQDSVSMISESVCLEGANIIILPLKATGKNNKFNKFIEILEQMNLVQIYKNEFILKKTDKLNLKELVSKVVI